MAVPAEGKRQASKVVRQLARTYPDATCALHFCTPLELLVATILSAQCTDVRVNQVTARLFAKYRRAADYATAASRELESEIQSTGFFRNKAKSIKGCCQALLDRFDGQVPQELEALVELPGVGRKTANVVLGTAFGIASGVVVDTHVSRLSQRLGLTAQRDPVAIEEDLMAILPRKEWIDFSHRMIHDCRQICAARKPKCSVCPMLEFCPQRGVTAHD